MYCIGQLNCRFHCFNELILLNELFVDVRSVVRNTCNFFVCKESSFSQRQIDGSDKELFLNIILAAAVIMHISFIEWCDLRPYNTASPSKIVDNICTCQVRACNIYCITQHAIFQSRSIVVYKCLPAAFLWNLFNYSCRIQIQS